MKFNGLNNMKYTRNQINNAGNIIMSSNNVEEVNFYIDRINDWRNNHLYALNILGDKIVTKLKTSKIKPVLTSQRLKRLTSIQYKLDLNPSMGLGGMQDIGGFRIVLKDVAELKFVDDIIINSKFDDFTLEKRYDYIDSPKGSGYRSIHFIYKYHSESEEYDGLRFELQIRTKIQHSWATAVETAGLYTNTSLKSNQGEDKWLNFFKVVSSLFAIKEQLPVMIEHKDYSMESLMVECYYLDKKNQISKILSALKVTVETVINNKVEKEYCIVNIDLINRLVTISIFDKKDNDSAVALYAELEKRIEDNKGAVVLVAVSSIKELKAAYPSYFLDTTDFISALEKINENCELYNLIKK